MPGSSEVIGGSEMRITPTYGGWEWRPQNQVRAALYRNKRNRSARAILVTAFGSAYKGTRGKARQIPNMVGF